MTLWHILTSEYPPDVGGVSDYTQQVAEALAREGDEVHVWCPPAAATRSSSSVQIHTEPGRFRRSDLRRLSDSFDMFPSPRRLLVQWVPHGYGYRSINLGFCLWLAGRARKGDVIELMVHEPFIELKPGPLRHIAIALVHRVMTMILLHSAARVRVAIPAWEPLLRPYALGRPLRIDWLPIPACMTSMSEPAYPVREAYADVSQPLIGHFGSYGQLVSGLLADRLPAVMESDARPSLLLIGAGSDAFRAALIEKHPTWTTRVHATGFLSPADLTRHLDACDLFLQPYPDGISSRRTSAMACLSRGCAVVTTSGHLTEPLWEHSGAVLLADVADSAAFAEAATQLLRSPADRQELSARARSLYDQRFDLIHTVAALQAA
jgi:glycosyltransferase involved in cell wall biosynthesis